MLKLIIFDFDGVIADSEPAHFEMFRRILGEGGLDLTWKQYTENYLGFDDFNAFTQILKSRDLPHSPELVTQLCRKKEEKFAKYLQDKSVIFPGVKDLLQDLAKHQVPCSIYSGAIRSAAQRRETCTWRPSSWVCMARANSWSRLIQTSAGNRATRFSRDRESQVRMDS